MSENARPNMTPYLDALGYEAKDVVTGSEGVITSVTFDLYGCIQYLVTPKITKDGKKEDSWWCDVNRMEIFKDRSRTMTPPPFRPVESRHLVNGPADKPVP